MRPVDESTSPAGRTPAPPSSPTAPNAFSAEFLAEARERDESLTTAEAEFAGPWKLEPVPGCPGLVAVLRESESLAEGDIPEAVFRDDESAVLCAAALPLIEREPLSHLRKALDPTGEPAGLAAVMPEGSRYPVISMYGEKGPQVRGWLRCFNPRIVQALHVLEGLNRSPEAHAAVLDVSGGGALERIGRALAARRRES